MICVSFFTEPSGEIVGFQVSGHSGYAEQGTDIVCAAVSSAVYMTANTITEVLKIPAEVSVQDGEMLVRVECKDAPVCRAFFAGLKLHLLGLEEQYSDFVSVSYTEV